MLDFDGFLRRVIACGVTVEWVRLDPGYAGCYDGRTRTIFLDVGLDSRPRHAISTLAHEAAHDWFGDTAFGDAFVEARADRKAAEWLVCPGRLRRAEVLHGVDEHAIAVELGVSDWVVVAARDMLTARAA